MASYPPAKIMAPVSPPIFQPDQPGLDSASETLRAGGLVAFPTETVYGLGADATQDTAVAAIFDAKGRPSFNPLIVHFPDQHAVWEHVTANDLASVLAKAFWPGPLTLVLPRQAGSSLSLLVSAGLDTVAVRVPAHDVAHRLLVSTGHPIAAPSANRSGSISPTRASHVRNSLGDRVDGIVDGGDCSIGIESTVIAIDGQHATMLRPGSITREDIEALIGPIRISDGDGDPTKPQSPGMLKRHYAPNTPVRLDAMASKSGDVFLGFGRDALKDAPEGSLNLSENADLREAAANLFAMLRQLDLQGSTGIAVSPIPESGLGVAINDRLRRAATPEKP